MLGGVIAGEAATGREAVEKYHTIRPDVVAYGHHHAGDGGC